MSGLSVGQGATELRNDYEVGNGRCACLYSRQYHCERYGEEVMSIVYHTSHQGDRKERGNQIDNRKSECL